MGSTVRWTVRHSSALQTCLKAAPRAFLQGAGLRASAFTEQHRTAKEAQAPGELFTHCPVGSLDIAGHKRARLGEFTIPNHNSVQKLQGVIVRERLQPFPTLPRTAGCMMLHLPAAYGGLKNKNDSSNVQICFITQKYACSGPGTRR